MNRKMKKFAKGDLIDDEISAGVAEGRQTLANQGMPEKAKSYKAEPGQASTGMKKETFGDAYKRNRAKGNKSFEWNGKTISTDLESKSSAKGDKFGKVAEAPAGDYQPQSSMAMNAPMSLRKASSSEKAGASKQRAERADKESSELSAKEQRRLLGVMNSGTVGYDRDIEGLADPRLKAARERAKGVRAKAEEAKGYGKEAVLNEANAAFRRGEEADRIKVGSGASGFKRGGSIKASSMGKVKQAKPSMGSASSRADGCAIRGKTRA